MNMHSVTLSAWSEVKAFARHGWIYRGQSESGLPLVTSLERSLERNAVAADRSADVEKELMREFRRAYREYADHAPDKADTLEWLSLMQHHGAPTRLLDFSYSIYIAAYFALENAEGTCSILAVNLSWAYRSTIALMERQGKDVSILKKEQLEEGDESSLAGLFLEPPTTPCACPVNPFRLNERLRVQKGIFLIGGDITRPFEANIQAMEGWDAPEHITRIDIPVALHRDAIIDLYYMNITRTSLFPGLDGYARSLGIYHPVLNPVDWS
jgi:hypothetical protein